MISIGGFFTFENDQEKNNMKRIYFENLMNKEKFYCTDITAIKVIDGVEYLRVFKYGTQRDCFVKKDSLRKISEKKVLPIK